MTEKHDQWEIERQKALEEIDKNLKPISFEVNDEIGSFKVNEQKSGSVVFEIENKSGKKLVLNDLVPPSYEVVGNIRVWRDRDNFTGLFNTETSVVMHEPNAFVVSERELKKEGWRYVLIFLHELGHIMRHLENPELKKESDDLFNKSAGEPKNTDLFKEAEKLYADDERDAWAFAIRKYREVIKELGLPKEKFFENTAELLQWLHQYSLGGKAEYVKNKIISRLEISDKEKEKLAKEIFKLYTRKESL